MIPFVDFILSTLMSVRIGESVRVYEDLKQKRSKKCSETKKDKTAE